MSDMTDRARDYQMTRQQADLLKGISLVPFDLRSQALRLHADLVGLDRFVDLFANFIGMANSVVANNREMVELLLITEGGMHPHTAEKANLPTIFGALQGIELAEGVDLSKVCAGCAYRLGTPANQSPSTTCDAGDVLQPGEAVFLCHAELDAETQPYKACGGYAQHMAARKAGAA